VGGGEKTSLHLMRWKKKEESARSKIITGTTREKRGQQCRGIGARQQAVRKRKKGKKIERVRGTT